MPYVRIEGADDLRKAGEALRAAPAVLRRELATSMRRAAAPVVKDCQETVRRAPSRARSTSQARRARAAHAFGRSKELTVEEATSRARGRETKRAAKKGSPISEARIAKNAAKAVERSVERRQNKAMAGAGLRESIARVIGSTVSTMQTKSKYVGLTFRARGSRMPPGQQKLAKDFNRPSGWRHPVFGDRDTWVVQTGSPYFDDVIKKHQGDLSNAVADAMRTTADKVIEATKT